MSAMQETAIRTEHALFYECQDLIHRELDLIDSASFEEWQQLFHPDGVYWVPVRPSRSQPRDGLNLIYDDMPRLTDRIRRLRSGYAHSEEPLSRTSHLIGNLRLVDRDKWGEILEGVAFDQEDVMLVGRVIVARHRPEGLCTFHGRVGYLLRNTPTGRLIRMKRVDLVAADQAMPTITFLL